MAMSEKEEGEFSIRLVAVLAAAFPTPAALNQVVKAGLGRELGSITGSSSLVSMVANIVRWAWVHGGIEALARAALQLRPDDPELFEVAAKLSSLDHPPFYPPLGDRPAATTKLRDASPTLRVDRLTVRNFRCFAERTFEFQPQFNVLIGENGTGKTAVLEALAVAVGSWLLGLAGADTRHIQPEDIRLWGQRQGEEITFEPQVPVEITARGEAYGQSLQWSRTLSSRKGRTTSAAARALKELATAADHLVRSGETITLPLVAYYGTGRLWLQPRDAAERERLSSQSELSRLEGYRGSIDDRVSAKELTRWLERQDRIRYQEGKEPELYRTVCRVMREMLEGARDVSFDNRRLEVVVEFEDGRIRPFAQLSDGQRNMLALAGDIAVRMARLNPHLGERVLDETPGIVLIDELDLHLHPTWQRHVVEDLRRLFPKIQFFATTHSPFIVQTLREGELLSLDTQSVPEVANLGIEDISRGLMGVEAPEVSPRYRQMVDTAIDYLSTLDAAEKAPSEKLAEFKDRLAQKIAPYADNPAYQAFLEMERMARLGE